MADELETKPTKLARASFFDGSVALYGNPGTFYMPGIVDQANQSLGLTPQKLIIPREYHQVVQMCYDFYQRGGMTTVVINRLAELSITKIRNGQRKTSDEANEYYDAVLHRQPSRMFRYINSLALEYFLSGMILPKVDWEPMAGQDISPNLRASKEYWMPTFDWYPPLLVNVVWIGWGKKAYFLKVPGDVIKLIRSGGSRIKEQQLKYQIYKTYYPQFVEEIKNGADIIALPDDIDPILRKEVSFNPYPTPFMYNILEALVFKQQLRRMDYAVATRVINAILLVQTGNDAYPSTDDSGDLEELKKQINARANNPVLLERVFELFANHTVKLTWVSPDVEALLNQEKYRQVNEELQEGLGFSRLLITGESRNAQASELSTYAVQPMMEELRNMLQEWMTTVYEEAAKRNKFRNIPVPNFTPIKLQDVVKTAAIFAQAFKEGNISRTTRDEQLGLDFETELELMIDEKDMMSELPKSFPQMPYNVQVIPGAGGGLFGSRPLTNGTGRPVGALNSGGRPQGSQNVPVNNRRSGVKLPGQQPTSRVRQTAEIEEDVELLNDTELFNLIDKVARERGIYLTMADLGFEEENENTSSQNE